MEKSQNFLFDEVGLLVNKFGPPKEMTPPKMHINRPSLRIILASINENVVMVCLHEIFIFIIA